MRRLACLSLSFALLAAACSGGDEDSSAEPSTTTTTEATTSTTTTSTSSTTSTTTTEAPAPGCADRRAGVTTFDLDSGGNTYGVRVFVPDGLDAEEIAPVVLNWHGLGSNGDQQAGFSGHERLAETEGYLVVSPTGFPNGIDLAVQDEARNSWELPQFDQPDRDDVVFADELIDLVIGEYCGDEQRVYSTGMSNGGLFTGHLVCELNHRIAAAVSVAGVTRAEPCDFERSVPYVALHGTEDDVVPYYGESDRSPLLFDGAPQFAIDFLSQVMPDEFGEIATDMGCDPEPVLDDVADDLVVHTYENCPDDAPVAFYEFVGAGHTWPGSPFGDALEEAGLGTTSDSYDATADAWAFMSQFTLS